MLKTYEYWFLCGLGVVAVLLVGLNIGLYTGNRTLQASVNARTQYIQQTGPVRELYQEIAKTLAELALKNHDDQVRTMLGAEGLTIGSTPPATSTPTPAPQKKP